MDANELFDACTEGDSKKSITGRTIYDYVICPFLTWCNFNAPRDERDAPSKFMHLLFDRGKDVESEILQKNYPDSKKLEFKSFRDGFRKVLNECFEGKDAILNAPIFFLKKDLMGICDILEKREGKSIFGDFYYVIKEIKSAKNVKREYILQAAFYNYVLGLIQDHTPKEFYVITKDGTEFAYAYEDFAEELSLILQGTVDIKNGKEISPTAKACRWPWESYAIKRAIEEDDISIVIAIGPVMKQKLNEAGINTIQQLAVAEKPDEDIPDALWKKMQYSAKAWANREPVLINKPSLPEKDVEFFIDFEGTDELQMEEGKVRVDYMIGVLKNDEVKQFVAHDLTGEEKVFKDFIALAEEYPDAPIYHYGPYEKLHLRQMGARYKIDVEKIVSRLIDVLTIVRSSVALPTISYSLKDIGKFLGYKWKELANGQESIALYMKYLETKDKEILNRILKYNEDDLHATKLIKDFLAKL